MENPVPARRPENQVGSTLSVVADLIVSDAARFDHQCGGLRIVPPQDLGLFGLEDLVRRKKRFDLAQPMFAELS